MLCCVVAIRIMRDGGDRRKAREEGEQRRAPPPPRPRKVGVAIQRLQVVGGGHESEPRPVSTSAGL